MDPGSVTSQIDWRLDIFMRPLSQSDKRSRVVKFVGIFIVALLTIRYMEAYCGDNVSVSCN